jgi:mitochondrial fission protein ELM1
MPLTPPWPDVVIAIGKSAASVVRWVNQQAGGDVICVQLGRPRTAYHHFDLLVTTPQFSMPPGNNVIRLTMPITLHDEEKLAAQAAIWQPRLAHLPRPWTAVLIGGDTTQLSFDAHDAAQLVDQLRDFRRQQKGSFIVTTSPRTPKAVADKLERDMPGPQFFFRWAKGVENPYQAFLSVADDFIITNDSVTMIAEAADRVKPIYLYTLPRRETEAEGLINEFSRRMRRRRERRKNAGLRRDVVDRLFDLMTESGHVRPRNNIDWFEATLYSQGIARPLGGDDHGVEALRPWAADGVTMIERNIVTERIGDLWTQRLMARALAKSD